MHRSSDPVRTRRVLLALAALLAIAQAARAQEDVKALEKRFQKLADEATPKTVCVKSYIEAKGDRAGYGSGAIISPDGYILTCAHVIDIAKRCEVMTSDGTVYKATVLGKNKRQDFALLKIDAKNLPIYKIGDSSKVNLGDWVVALGHPGGPYQDLKPAFAAGKVTGLHKKLPVQFFDRFYDDGIQTDVPIFAGNSGGPLVSLDGQLIGLNGAILILNENAYAVPINEVMADYAALQKGEILEGKAAKPEDLAELQKQIGPEEYQKLFGRAFKNFGKLFGGDENGGGDFSKIFEQFGKMFGNGGGGEKGEDGEEQMPSPDMSKLFEQFGKMFGNGGGKPGEAPDLSKIFEKFFGGDGKPGEGQPDMSKMMEQLKKMMEGNGGGGENGEGPDLGKLLEQFGKMFGDGGEEDGDEDEAPAPAPAPRHRPRDPAAAPAGPGFVGVQLAQPEAAKSFGGALIDDVLADSPAAKAGLKKGDVVVAVDGVGTPDADALRREVGKHGPGTKTVFTIDRAKAKDATVVIERKDVTVTIGKRPAEGGR